MTRSRSIHKPPIDPSPNDSRITLNSSDSSPASSTTKLSSRSSSTGPSSTGAPDVAANATTTVLCMHDYVPQEETGLAFRKNELLIVLKKENTGWWAAMREGSNVVGWIPEAFVRTLSVDMAERLRNVREEMRIFDYQAEMLYTFSPVSTRTSEILEPASPQYSLVRDDSIEDQRPSSPNYPPQYHSVVCPEPTPTSSNPTSPLQAIQALCPLRRGAAQTPPSPIPTTMPHPSTKLSPTLANKPVPPLPVEEIGLDHKSSLKRSLRRRPLLLDDNTTLSRLSTMIETRNRREVGTPTSDLSGSIPMVPMLPLVPQRSNSSDITREDRNLHYSFQILKPWYLLPSHADQLEMDYNGHVRSGSLLALTERLTSETTFQELSRPTERSTFAAVFLMTYRTFTTSEELCNLLLDRFSITRPDNLNEAEVEDWKTRLLLPTQRHVIGIFSLWIEQYRLLEDDPIIAQRLPDFLRHVVMPRLPTEARSLMQAIERMHITEPPRAPMGLVSKKPAKKYKSHKNDLLRIDPIDIAEQLTIYEYHLYSKVTSRECLSYINKQTGPEVSNLLAFCETYDKLVGWVKMSILGHIAIAKRAQTIDFWIKVAEKCRQMNNVVSMSAIVTALSSTVITALVLTWTHVNRKSQLDSMQKLNEPLGGFAVYRRLMANIQPSVSCVPFITMYLMDLVRIRSLYQDENDRIMFIQRQRWYDTITSILKFQNRQYFIIYNEQVATFIQNHLKTSGTRDDDWFWAKSQEIQRVELANADIRKGLEQAGF